MKYSKELLEKTVKDSLSYSSVCKKLGVLPAGGMWNHIKSIIKKYDIDTSHFLGKAAHAGSNHTGKTKKLTAAQILVEGKESRERGSRLRRALLEIGREYKCESCSLTDVWNGKPIALEVDHINGDWSDCREDNLRFLCPNCHSQTANFQKPLECDGST